MGRGGSPVFAEAENPGGPGGQGPVCGKFVNGFGVFVVGIDLNEGVFPIPPRLVGLSKTLLDVLRSRPGKTRRKPFVSANQFLAEIKDVFHDQEEKSIPGVYSATSLR